MKGIYRLSSHHNNAEIISEIICTCGKIYITRPKSTMQCLRPRLFLCPLEEPRNPLPVKGLATTGIGGLLGSLVGKELLLFAIDDVLAGVEVALVRAHTLALGVVLVAEDKGQVDGDADVAGDEGRVLLLLGDARDEGVEVLGDGYEAADEERRVRAPDAQGCRVRHLVVGKALRLACAYERDVRYKN